MRLSQDGTCLVAIGTCWRTPAGESSQGSGRRAAGAIRGGGRASNAEMIRAFVSLFVSRALEKGAKTVQTGPLDHRGL